MSKEKSCEICGKICKDSRGLAGHRQWAHQVGSEEEAKTATKAQSKSSSLEAAVDRLKVPAIPEKYNGEAEVFWDGFNRGVCYGANTILAGIKSAQELSALGISQARPVIAMATEMRQAEGQAAQEIAGQLAQVHMESNQQVLSAINSLAASQDKEQPAEANPVAEMMADAMKPYLQQTMQQVFSGMMVSMPQQATGQQQQPGQQQQQTHTWQPPNITRRSIDEYEGIL